MPKRQRFTNSCGAACLVNAAHHLGQLTARQCTDALEEQVYNFTSGGRRDAYSMPSGIVDACHYLHATLGLQVVDVRLEGFVFPGKLRALYPNEIGLVGGANVHIGQRKLRKSGFTSIRAGQVELFVVLVNGGLHWLLHTGNNNYIDPDTGLSYRWWTSWHTWTSKYIDTGVSVIVQAAGQPNNSARLYFNPPANLNHPTRPGGWI